MLHAPSGVLITFLAHGGAPYKLTRDLGRHKVVNMKYMQLEKANRQCGLI
jgi:hypothetical protein